MNLRVNVSFRRILTFLMALWIVLEGRSIWLYMSDIGGTCRAILKVLMVVTFIIMIMTGSRSDIQRLKAIGPWIALFSLYIFVYGIITQYALSTLLLWLICVDVTIITIYISNDIDGASGLPSLVSAYVKIIYTIAIISLFFWMMGGVLHIIPYTGTYNYTWSNSSNGTPVFSYLNLYYTVGPQKALGITIDRNSAIFSEAPMAALHFSFALLTEMYLSKNTSKIKVIVLIAAIISTLSTMAIIVIMIAFAGKYVIRRSKNTGEVFLKIVFVILLMLISYFVIYELLSMKLQQLSGVWRVNDYEVGFNVWRQNVLFGVGFQNDKAIQDAMPAWRSYNMGYSNSIMQLLAQGGIYLAIPYILSIYRGLKYSLRSKMLNYTIFILCFIFLFIVCVFTYNLFAIMYLLVIYEIKKLDETGIKSRNNPNIT